MSRVWEFALTPKRLAIVAGCLGVAGLVLAVGGFAVGVILAPRVRSDLNVITKNGSSETAPPVAARSATGRLPAATPAAQPVTATAAKQAVPAPVAAAGPTPDSTPARTAAMTGTAKELPIQLDVRVASFASDETARNTVAQLRDSGYPAMDVPWKDASSQEWHVVEVGPYAAHEAASRTVLELSTKYGFNPVIVASRVP